MSLRNLFLVLFGIKFTLVIGLGIMILSLFRNADELSNSRDVYFRSWVLADELRQSSDDLTRMARTYVATGNPEYERQYYAVLDIRNGKKPRPVCNNKIYWDLIITEGQKPCKDGNAISLNTLMIKEGFTSAELDKLAEAQKNSDELVNVERIAMNAVKGLYDDGKGNFIVMNKPNRELAIKLMNDVAYHKTKASIMRPINDFYIMFDKRTASTVEINEIHSRNLLWGILTLILVIMGLFVFSFVLILRQIRYSEKAEKVLGESEEKYRTLIETMSDGVYRSSHAGKFLEVNPAMVKILGYDSKEELLAIDIKTQLYFAEEDRESAALEELREEMAVFRLRKKDGSEIWVEDHGRHVLDDEGNILYHEGSLRDVSERLRAEVAVQEQNKILEAMVLERTMALTKSKQLLDATSILARIGGWELDVKTNEITWTDMVCEIHEVSHEFKPDLQSEINFYAPESIPAISEAVRAAIEEGKPFDLELQFITAKKNRLWVRSIGRAFWSEGKIVRIGGVFQDITDHKNADDELKKYREHLEEIVKARTAEKDKIFNVIAHDLRSPFTSLLGFTELLAGGVESFTLGEIQQMANRMNDSASNLFKLLENLLEWSRIQRGMVEFSPTICDLSEIVLQSLSIYSLQAAKKEISIINSVPAGTEVIADKQMLNTIIRNLISNAVKFSHHGGSVILASKRNNENKLEFSVHDKGIGMSDQLKTKIFVMGSEISRKGTDNEPSTGLGLLLCKEYIEKNDGKLWVESKEGEGSTFYFTFPENIGS